MTRETVIGDTPASRATSEIVGAPVCRDVPSRGFRVDPVMPHL
ncbi:hypothetical protein EBBID32_3400 [Sphingobium indicum BiD32]|uniref:Uncharacterized protein n=1 Tax=Sphingobium indicum BiD32 TaxID=1301087 RepID=N1MGV1_9SPHN|nr:hypothetical protein EBBID32_3400 [Sphingobium indicum BiD32]